MKFFRTCLSLLLILSVLLTLVSGATVGKTETMEQDTAPVRAVSVSGISVPAYSGGTSSGWMEYDCGETVTFHDTGVKSKMRIVAGTNASQYNTYCSKLTSNGYTKVYSKTVAAQSGSNLYSKFLSKDGSHSIYTYFTAAYSQTRIIVDTQSHTVEGFQYSGTGSLPTEVYMYSLAAEESGWGLSDSRKTQFLDNAGSFYIIRMPDNSLYIQDGGSTHQMSEREMENVYAFCRKITGTKEGERMIINAWCISHGDTDHYRGFTRFIQAYHKDFDLKNVIYNFEIDNGTSYHFRRVTRHFPNVRYYKPHTGESFNIAGVQFDVLYTTEDRYTPSSSNTLTPHDSSCIPDDYLNYNNTSLVFRMSFEGKKMILAGDIFKADAVLLKMYPASAFKADVLQIPHHGFDDHSTLAKTVSPTVIFLNQVETAVLNRERLYNNNAGWEKYCKEIYYGGSEIVGYRAKDGVFYREKFKGFESLNWSAIVYHIEDRNYQNTATPVKDPEAYYRYTRATELTTTDRAYIIVDDKLNKVLAYDNGTGGVASAIPSLYDGENFYFSASRRYLVNWLISARSTVANENAAITGSTTYHGGVPIRKGTGDYWGTGSKNSGIYLGVASSYSAEGLHGAWSSFSNQLYAESKATWVDAMEDGTFLIYRHGNGTYYPLYRDGDVATEKGWGCTKLTKTQVNARIDNLRLRLYVYEETPSDMYLSWTGYTDYYAETGVPLNDMVGHIFSNIRVNYSFAEFDGGGEIEYDAMGTKMRGRYYLEFTKTYDPNTVGDYPVLIKYTNAAGTTLTLGSLTVHLYKRSATEPELQELYFDFGDTDADRDRYELNKQYQEVNFDGSDRWLVTEDDADLNTGKSFGATVDQEAGTLTATITNTSTTNRALYIQPYAINLYPLNYSPTYAQTVQIRVKLENLKACSGQDPFFRLWYYKGSDNLRKYDRNVLFGRDYVSNGEYITLRFDLYSAEEITGLAAGGSKPDTTFANAGKISGLRMGFHGFVLADPSKSGSITIDYIYIGPKANAPSDQVTVIFTDDEGNILQEEQVLAGSSVSFTGVLEPKPGVPEGHYRFSHWADANGEAVNLESVTENLVLHPMYIMEPHEYTMEYLDEEQHRGVCYCSYETFGDHSWSEGVVESHPCITEGVVRYTCTQCSGSKTTVTPAQGHKVEIIPGKEPTCTAEGLSHGEYCTVCGQTILESAVLPPLGHEVVTVEGQAPTCTNSGLSDYTYCTRCSETLTAQTILPRLGHSYTYTDNGDGTHRAECIRGDKTLVQEHSFQDGACQCGARAVVLDPQIRILHSLDLTSDISVNFVVAKSQLQDYDLSSVYLECTVNRWVTQIGTETVRLHPVEQGYYYYFTLEGLTAVQMSETITAVLHGTRRGQDCYSTEDQYSVAGYAYSQLNKDGVKEELKTLCADLLRYGAAAQIYKDYATEHLADRQLTDAQRVYLTDTEKLSFGNTNLQLGDVQEPSVIWLGKTLNLGSKVTVKYVFSTAKYAGSSEELSLRVRYTDIYGMERTCTIRELEDYNAEQQQYAFSFDGLLAAELRSVLSAQIYAGDTPVSVTMVYSPDTYGNGKTGTLGELCKALFAYSDAAKAYFTN